MASGEAAVERRRPVAVRRRLLAAAGAAAAAGERAAAVRMGVGVGGEDEGGDRGCVWGYRVGDECGRWVREHMVEYELNTDCSLA